MIVSANRVVAAPRHPLAKLLPTLSVERLWECALGSMDCCELVGWVTFTSGRSRRPEGIPVATERKAIRKPVRYDARPSRGWGACGGLAMTWRALPRDPSKVGACKQNVHAKIGVGTSKAMRAAGRPCSMLRPLTHSPAARHDAEHGTAVAADYAPSRARQ
eukprot:scaffold68234_cov26-Tisochrysis_lutea.AAC.3